MTHQSARDEQRIVESMTGEPLSQEEIDRRVEAGELTNAQASELMQEAARRKAVEDGTSIPEFPGDHVTRGGFGSEQGMGDNESGPSGSSS